MDISQASDAASAQTGAMAGSFSSASSLTSLTVSETMLTAIPDAVVAVNSDGEILRLNDQAEHLFGYSGSALLGQPVEWLIPERFQEVHREHRLHYGAAPHIRRMGSGLELYGRRRDGSEFPVEVSLFPLDMGEELLVLAIVRDITRLKHLEAVAREQAEQFARTFDVMGDAVYIYDRQGRLVTLNAVARAHSGYNTQPELMRESARERIQRLHPRDVRGHPLPPAAWPIQRVLQGEVISTDAPVEYVITTAAGREMILQVTGAPLHDADGRVAGAVLVAHDVTKQWHLEREVAVRAQEIARIFDTEVDGVMLFDAEGRNVRMNAAYRRLYGYEASQQVEPVAPEERARRFVIRDTAGHPLLQRRGRSRGFCAGRPWRTRRLSRSVCGAWMGGNSVLSISGAPLVGRDGQVLGGVLTTHDVTELRRLEQQRADILRMVAHDLASPITAMKIILQNEQHRQEQGLPSR